MFNDADRETLNIQVDLPGVTKASIAFTLLENGLL
jgi:HSP20 family molecular chaperone IbpA